MKSKKSVKNLIAFILVAIIIFSCIPSCLVGAFNYPKISLGKEQKGKLQDYFGAVSYEFNLKNDAKILINYSSTVDTDLTVCDDKLNTIKKFSNVKRVKENIELKSGVYVIGIYNCTYSSGTYSLKLTDKSFSKVKISFANSINFLKVGDFVKLKLNRQPENGNIDNTIYSSSKTNVASVNKNGKVTAKALGKTTITAKLGKNQTAKCDVIVNQSNIQVFQAAKKTLPKINGKVPIYSVYSTSIATVNNRKLTGVSHGATTISTYVDGYYYYINAKVIARKTLYNQANKRLKSNDKGAKIVEKYRGYNNSGKACVVLNYISSLQENKYLIAYYDDNFKLKAKTQSRMPNLSNKKSF